MVHSGEMIIQLIGSEVCGSTLSLRAGSPVSEKLLLDMFNLSRAHDLTHIVGAAIINNKLAADSLISEQYRNCVYSTLYRFENLNYVLEKVSSVLETEKIPYIPLKGAVIKELYPQPWMRTGCDIDILVHEEDADNAAKKITEALGYKHAGKNKHDIQILSTENIYVELHFNLLEEDAAPAMAKVLNRVWEHAKPVNSSFRYELDNAMFYYYHIAHMAKHFLKGGCGIKPFIDLWLMEKSGDYNTSEVRALLKKGRLTDFAETAEKLSRAWFSGEEHDRVTKLMEEFVLSGGCFGTKETRMLSGQQKSGGRKKFILSRIFVPYDELKKQYPILNKYKIFTPVCEICRLFSLAFGKKKKFRKSYLGNLNSVSDDRIDDINLLFESVGL